MRVGTVNVKGLVTADLILTVCYVKVYYLLIHKFISQLPAMSFEFVESDDQHHPHFHGATADCIS